MKLTTSLLCLGALVISATCAAAKPAYVASTVNLRAAPGTTNEIVAKIPAGSLVEAGDCTEGWCAVTWQEKSGFAIQTALDVSGRVPSQQQQPRRARAPDYPPDDDYIIESGPAYYYGPRPYYGYYGYGRPYYRGGWRRW